MNRPDGVKREIHFAAFGGAVIAAVTLALLERHHPNLAFSYRDGVDAIGLLNYIRKTGFSGAIPFFNLQTLGGFYGLNHWLSPSMWLIAAFGTSQSLLDASYVLCAIELYFTTYLLSRIMGATRIVAAAAGLLLPLFVLPLVWNANPFSSPLTLSTGFGDLIVLNNLILIGLAKALTPDTKRAWAYALLIFAIAWLVLLMPLATILPVPFDLVFYGVISARMIKADTFWRAHLCLVGVFAILLCVFGPYLFGLFENTSSSLFGPELRGDIFTDSWHLLPIPFRNFENMFWSLVIFLALAGTARSRPLPPSCRTFAQKTFWILGFFGLMALLCSAGFVFLAKGSATFPRPAYFEIVAWPFYFIAISVIGDAIWTWVQKWLPPNSLRNEYHVFSAFAILAAILGIFALQRYVDRIMPYRPRADSLVQFLQAKLTAPGQSYAGQVATFAGTANNVGDLLAYDRSVELSVGNAHRGEMLRYFGLPTLDEYNSLIGPEKYLLLTRFFARPTDDQSRAMTVYTKVNQEALAALGVRYVVTDHALPPPAMLMQQEAVPGVGTHFLYELPGVNLGNYTPTTRWLFPTLEDELRGMLKPGFDFRKEVVVRTKVPPLTSARSRMWVTPGLYRIEASSAGTSLVVLPIAFTHCLRWENGRAGLPPPQLLRVDFALTGILFNHAVSGAIRPVQSPFADPFCGIRDWREARSLSAHYSGIWPAGAASTAP